MPSIRWGQEQVEMKENEIQIVTLEKQKDTYQVIFQRTRNLPKIGHVLDVANKELKSQLLLWRYENFMRSNCVEWFKGKDDAQ